MKMFSANENFNCMARNRWRASKHEADAIVFDLFACIFRRASILLKRDVSPESTNETRGKTFQLVAFGVFTDLLRNLVLISASTLPIVGTLKNTSGPLSLSRRVFIYFYILTSLASTGHIS